LAVALALIYQEVGASMFAGFALVVVTLPIMMVLMIFFAKFRSLKSKHGDERVKIINEVLAGIRVIKYYAWEKPFLGMITKTRDAELQELANMNYLIVFFMLIIMSIPVMMPVIIFFAYVSQPGNQLDAAKAFTTLAYFGMIQNPILQIPGFIQKYYQAKVSGDRILKFLLSDELVLYVKTDGMRDPSNAIEFNGASLSWTTASGSAEETVAEVTGGPAVYKPVNRDEDSEGAIEMVPLNEAKPSLNRSIHTLIDLDIQIKRGQLCGVIGPVGSGKTSLLSALLGDLSLTSGTVHMAGTLAYHAQQPWILNATVKDNILLGSPYDEKRFEETIRASCLAADIAILPGGVDTEIGEKGINLSGGE
jgi:ATP-binding cassette, subfamily C (CFTR/MRP), member 1